MILQFNFDTIKEVNITIKSTDLEILEKKYKTLPLTNDYVFKRIFGKEKNKPALKDFLEAILNINIESIEVMNPEIPKNFLDEKLGVLDIKAKINENTTIDIEMQLNNVKHMPERNIEYASKLITEETIKGQKYTEKNKTICITILGKNLIKNNYYHNIALLQFQKMPEYRKIDLGYNEANEQKILTDIISFHYIELEKFKKKAPRSLDRLVQWLWLMVGNEEMIKVAEKENKILEDALNDLNDMSKSQKERLEAFDRMMARKDYYTYLEDSKSEGKLEGKIEEKMEIAKRMKEKNIPIEEIIEITELTKEQIENL